MRTSTALCNLKSLVISLSPISVDSNSARVFISRIESDRFKRLNATCNTKIVSSIDIKEPLIECTFKDGTAIKLQTKNLEYANIMMRLAKVCSRIEDSN